MAKGARIPSLMAMVARIIESRAWNFFEPYLKALTYLLLGFSGIVSNPFGLSDASNIASENAYDWITSSFYESYREQAEDNILVVLVNETSIDNLYQREPRFLDSNEWPLTYMDHANLLSTMIRFNPAAVFVDIMFYRERSTDQSLDRALNKLARQLGNGENTTELFFAQGPTNTIMTDQMKARLGSIGSLVVNSWAGSFNSYPLAIESGISASMALFQAACLKSQSYPGCADFNNEAEFNIPLKVIWGSDTPEPIMTYRQEECQTPPDTLASKVWSTFVKASKGFVGKSAEDETLCGFTQYIYADELIELERSEHPEDNALLGKLLEGSIILYGTAFDDIDDRVISPVHRSVPGIFFHAMALDNLLSHGGDYRKSFDGQTINLLFWTLWVVVISIWLAHRKEGVPALKGIGCLFVFLIFIILVNRFILNYSIANWIGMMFMAGTMLQMIKFKVVENFISRAKNKVKYHP
ncbi:CHASE2 domain-containing protein [Endozoicomonas sp. ONNA2]|uniref:CHASE2 domain-containing protein n=1 Tax=Endozoicomonas sp. ONNA2 TaxID=2828741 RepID=UPI0021491116|nr:CHASE2 domain-containing protein [Endozoicomonas sp. ONNA2]